MADSYKQLCNVRKGHRGYIATLLSKTVDIDQNVALIYEQLGKIEKLNEKILSTFNPDDDISAEMTEMFAYEDKVKRQLFDLQTKVQTCISVPTNANFNVSQANVEKVKLPKIEIPCFDGDVSKFCSFWNLFESCVHNSSSLSDISKFSYLKTLLKGNALQSINGLQLSSENYGKAVDIIKDRFGRKEVIMKVLIDKLLNLPSVGCGEISKLRYFYDHIESNVRNLEAIKVDKSSFEVMLLNVIQNKLPNDMLISMAEKDGTKIWTLDKFLNAFKQMMEIREIYQGSSSRVGEKVAPSSVPGERLTSSVQALSTTEVSGNSNYNNRKIFCAYCDQPHHSYQCVKSLEQKLEVVRKKRLCFRCLGSNHSLRYCKYDFTCYYCKGHDHHSSICRKEFGGSQKVAQQARGVQRGKQISGKTPVTVSHDGRQCGGVSNNSEDPKKSSTSGSDLALLNVSSSIMLQTARVYAYDQSGSKVSMRILFDKGSSKSFICKSLRQQLNLPSVGRNTLLLNTFGDVGAQEKVCDVVRLKLCKDGKSYTGNFHVVNNICSPLQQLVDVSRDVNVFNNLVLADPEYFAVGNYEIDILIGCDQYWDIVCDEIVRSGKSKLVAMDSIFGYLVSGKHYVSNKEKLQQSNHVCLNNVRDSSLKQVMANFWNVESIGICGDTQDENDDVLHFFEKQVCRSSTESEYIVKIPWIVQALKKLPDNFNKCRVLLSTLQKRLIRDSIIESYNDVIQSQIGDGTVEEVTDVGTYSEPLHYLPHHAVVSKDKQTTKVRVVFNASFRPSKNALCLNDCIHQGPNLLVNMLNILIRFRLFNVVLLSDIEKAYLRIGLHESDRDAARFLWLKDILQPPNEDNIICLRLCKVFFGCNVSQFLLAATVKHHLEQYKFSQPFLITKLMESFYVDYMLTGCDSVEEAEQFYDESKEILLEGNFRLRKWSSNVEQLRDKFQEDGDLTPPEVIKVLGILWNSWDDTMIFDFQKLYQKASMLEPTKRSVLKVIGKFFDPQGVLSPFILRGKLLFQDLCFKKGSWDDVLPDEQKRQWLRWICELETTESLKFPRQYFGKYKATEPLELHIFTDSSQSAYAAVSYIKLVDSTDPPTLVLAKSRVAPLKKLSIPRLELLGALLGARIAANLKVCFGNYNVVSINCWCDSQNVLYWLYQPHKDWKLFVANKINEILSHTKSSPASNKS